jgi:nucleoside-diphosphate-sugar epimerase
MRGDYPVPPISNLYGRLIPAVLHSLTSNECEMSAVSVNCPNRTTDCFPGFPKRDDGHPSTVRIVVTGASGNVGTALLRCLHRDDWTVTGIARRPPDSSCPPYSGASWVACDLGAAEAPSRLATTLAGADAVVHLAWSINPSSTDPRMSRTNLIGTRQLLSAVAEAGVPHLVCLSSAAAYRPPSRWQEVGEDWPCDGVPGSLYSQHKAHLERLLDQFLVDHPGTAVARMRPCAIVGRDAAGEFARWLLSPLLPSSVVGRQWLPLPLWPGLRAQFVHSLDVAEAIRLVLLQRAAGPFNIAAGPPLNARELAATISAPVIPVPRAAVLTGAWAGWRIGLQPTHPGWLRLADRAALVDPGRARDELGWRPRHDAPAALAEVVAGIRAGTGTASAPLAARHLPRVTERLRAITWGKPSHQTQSTRPRRRPRLTAAIFRQSSVSSMHPPGH